MNGALDPESLADGQKVFCNMLRSERVQRRRFVAPPVSAQVIADLQRNDGTISRPMRGAYQIELAQKRLVLKDRLEY
jgi:hypothetical protein